MNVTRFDNMLSSGLGDTSGVIYTATMRTIAMSNAVRAYSRYRGFKRRYGCGTIYTTITTGAGAQTLYFVGLGGVGITGGVSLPLTVTLDYGTPWAEDVIITAISRPAPDDNLDSTALIATLASPGVLATHYAGGMIWQATPGLNIVAGTDTYQLCLDFIEPDRDTWDMATGSRRWIKRTDTFYDGLYRESENIGGVGWGQSQGFGRPGGMSGAFLGVPAGSGTNLAVPSGGDGPDYIFTEGSPTTLQVVPSPTVSMTLDFQYYGQHIPENVPDADMDALLFLAKADCYDQRSGALGAIYGFKEADVDIDTAKLMKSLAEQAKQAREKFDDYIRTYPLAVSG